MKKVTKTIPGHDLHALVWQEDDLYVAECVEVVVASQGESVDDALANLAEAVRLYLQEDDTVLPIPDAAKRKNLQIKQFSYA